MTKFNSAVIRGPTTITGLILVDLQISAKDTIDVTVADALAVASQR